MNYPVRSYMNAARISTDSATITVTDLNQPSITDLPHASTRDSIQVKVFLPYSSVAFCRPWFFENATIVASSVMRKNTP